MYGLNTLRASTLVGAKSCKMQKTLKFTHFGQKNTHIIGCKNVHKCIIVTVTMHNARSESNRDKEREKITKILNASATITVILYAQLM